MEANELSTEGSIPDRDRERGDPDRDDPGGDDLTVRMSELERRVALLEHGRGPDQPPRPVVDPDTFWALARLAERTGPEFERDGVAGSLLYAGRATTPGGGELIWQAEHPLPGVLAEGWEDAAAVLAALGNPVRLEIVRRILLGGETVQQLQEIPELGTSGQLYHHLRDLQSAGLVTQRRRGRYGVAPDKVIPALVIIAAAANMAAVPAAHEDPR
jgi:DNA-binding transcriptional ArsR family regulator